MNQGGTLHNEKYAIQPRSWMREQYLSGKTVATETGGVWGKFFFFENRLCTAAVFIRVDNETPKTLSTSGLMIAKLTSTTDHRDGY